VEYDIIGLLARHLNIGGCMDKQSIEWNKIFLNLGDKKPKYDEWLDKYEDILEKSKDMPIIDLGCGFGNDTLYLYERGFKVISCDYSIEALNRLKYFILQPEIKHFDMVNGLPFENDSSKVIIADLSLHYFSKNDTDNIFKEISRVLVPGGHLLCRVNSVRDINHGAGQGIQLEDNFYDIDGKRKRFFDRNHIDVFFRDWVLEYINECEMNRYKEKKIVWEIAAKNSKSSAHYYK
jgi:SAM-dependent methyltransferase